MISFKETAKLDFTSSAICHILYHLTKVSKLCERDLTITSGNDSKHLADSKHYTNQAVDVRSKFFSQPTKTLILDEIKKELGEKFFVDLEYEGLDNEHIHIQVRKGGSFP